MKTTRYPGIDYSHGASNRDTNTNIRYGVISLHSVSPDATEDIYTHGEDIAWKEALAAHLAEKRAKWAEAGNDPEDFDEDEESEEFGLGYESDGLHGYLYEREGYKLTGCLQNDLFVLKSPFYTYAQFCSPCVPGAGNLDSVFQASTNQESKDGTEYAAEAEQNGFPKVYCLGHDWFEDGAPYAVYSVETGKLVVHGEND